MSFSVFDDTVSKIYETALGAEHWAEAASAIAAEIGAVSHEICLADTSGKLPAIELSNPLLNDSQLNEYYTDYVDLNGRIPGVLDAMEAGSLYFDQDRFSKSKREQDPFFRWCAGLGLGTGASIPLHFGQGMVFGLGFHRTPESGDFTPEERATLTRYAPHIRRASKISQVTLSMGHKVQSQSLETLPYGALLLCRRGKILAANARAELLVQTSDTLSLSSEGLFSSERSEDTSLRRMLSRVTALDAPMETRASSLRIGGPKRGQASKAGAVPLHNSLFLIATPIANPEARLFDLFSPVAQITLLDPVSFLNERGTLLFSKILGLSEREAEVALVLGRGEAPKTAAYDLNMSMPTMRTHIRNIFYKLGISRQSELVAMVARVGQIMPADTF